ncbi:DUF1302 family protein [Desulfoluna limicola]|uniref:DUF1302 family protein n=1 Tax=Desulfoluna limicola TaxID=2810562 RepID=UPI001F40F349|nr:DUF1302 family protein [Desulfoluna limicola]
MVDSFDDYDGFEGGLEDEVFDEGEVTASEGGDHQLKGPDLVWPEGLDGVYSHQLAFGTKDSDIITNRSSLRCEFERLWSETIFTRFDGKAFVYYGSDHMAEAENKRARFEEKVRELYVQTSGDRFMVKVGRQVVVWGETEAEVVNDVVSPRDQTELVFIDLEDSRVGQNMVSAELYPGFGDMLLFVSFNPVFNETPEQRTRYFRGIEDLSVTEETSDFFDNEAGGRWKKVFGKSDLALMAATLLQNDGVLVSEGGSDYRKVHGRYAFYGIGASHTIDGFLFKADVAFKNGYALQAVTGDGRLTGRRHDVLDAALGMEFDANGRYSLNTELTNRHIFGFESNLYHQQKDSTGFYLQYDKNFLSDTLAFQYSYHRQLQVYNEIHKARLDHSFSDHIELTLDYVHFESRGEESFLWEYRDEDRVSAEFRYFF